VYNRIVKDDIIDEMLYLGFSEDYKQKYIGTLVIWHEEEQFSFWKKLKRLWMMVKR
jgi:hypothetical protein